MVIPIKSSVTILTRILGDPFTDILIGGRDRSLDTLLLRANVRAALIGGQLDVMSIGPNTSDIVGAALWYPPGKKAFATYVAIIRTFDSAQSSGNLQRGRACCWLERVYGNHPRETSRLVAKRGV